MYVVFVFCFCFVLFVLFVLFVVFVFFFFFFFQAEDGIRDVAVTGVQTCALPIFRVSSSLTPADPPVLANVNVGVNFIAIV